MILNKKGKKFAIALRNQFGKDWKSKLYAWENEFRKQYGEDWKSKFETWIEFRYNDKKAQVIRKAKSKEKSGYAVTHTTI